MRRAWSWGITLVLTMGTGTVCAQAPPILDPDRGAEGYHPPIYPYPVVSTFCAHRPECMRDGRCTQAGERCVATSLETCALSERCNKNGRCFLDREKERCDDGRRLASPGTLVAGAVITGVGGLGFFGGVLLYLSSIECEGFDCRQDGLRESAGIGLMIGGPLTAAALGLPIILKGTEKEWRPGLVAVGATVGPTSAALEVSF
jgi:hypothetical protein